MSNSAITPNSEEINTAEDIEKIAQWIRYLSVDITYNSYAYNAYDADLNSSTCPRLPITNLASVIYFSQLRWDPGDPKNILNDKMVWSGRNAMRSVPVIYSVLALSGAISLQELANFIRTTKEGGLPELSEDIAISRMIEAFSISSFGRGLSVASGVACAQKIKGLDSRTYCILSVAELSEGQIWESADFAAHNCLNNLIAFVDANCLDNIYFWENYNKLHDVRNDGSLINIIDKFMACGWKGEIISGYDVSALMRSCERARWHQEKHNFPYVIVLDTIKSDGADFMETSQIQNDMPPKEKLKDALSKLPIPHINLPVSPKKFIQQSPRYFPDSSSRSGFSSSISSPASSPISSSPSSLESICTSLVADYELGEMRSTLAAYENALIRMGDYVVMLNFADSSPVCRNFKKKYPKRFIECRTAEQNAADVALGLSTMGEPPFLSYFAASLSKSYHQIRTSQQLGAKITFAGCGESSTSIGNLDLYLDLQIEISQLSVMGGIDGSIAICPSDAVSAEKCVKLLALRERGAGYLHLSQCKVPVIYENGAEFHIGGSHTLRESKKDAATLISAGVQLHSALRAYDILKESGIDVRIIDAYSINPLDEETIRKAYAETRLVYVIEDAALAGGIGEAVNAIINASVMAGKGIPSEERAENFVEKLGINANSLSEIIRQDIYRRKIGIFGRMRKCFGSIISYFSNRKQPEFLNPADQK